MGVCPRPPYKQDCQLTDKESFIKVELFQPRPPAPSKIKIF